MIAEVGSSTQWKPKSNPWLIAATVALAAFMEVLDNSIVNVALPHIAGDLGASTSIHQSRSRLSRRMHRSRM